MTKRSNTSTHTHRGERETEPNPLWKIWDLKNKKLYTWRQTWNHSGPKVTTEKCFINDKMILAAVDSSLYNTHWHTTRSVSPFKYKYFSTICLPLSEQSWLRTLFMQQHLHPPTEVKLAFTFIHMTHWMCSYIPPPPVYFSALEWLSEWSFILMKWAKLKAKREEWMEGDESCFVTALSAMMQFIINMQIEQQGVSLHLVFTLLQHSQVRPMSYRNQCIRGNQFSYDTLKSLWDLGYTKSVQVQATA